MSTSCRSHVGFHVDGLGWGGVGHCLGSLETVQGTAYVQLAAYQQSLGRGTVETLKKQAFGGETCMETSENP